jgi:GNAT superfamily N-acetyltransferase
MLAQLVQCEFAVESWPDFWRDAEGALIYRHYQELALHQGQIPLSPDVEKYEAADKLGMAHIVTVRHEGKLVGYFIAAIIGHLHYKNAGPMATTDIYYLSPEFRTGGIGLKMLLFLEESLKAKGVVKIYLSTKAHQDHGPLFEALGYQLSDRVFTKLVT